MKLRHDILINNRSKQKLLYLSYFEHYQLAFPSSMIQSPSPAFKIKQIQSSLKSLCTQIKILGRSENHNIKSLQKCFDQCIPLIKSKIEQSKQHFKVKRMYQESQQEKENRVLGIKLKKYDEMKKKSNVRSLIFSIKHKEANEIREQSVKHMQLMKEQKIKQHQQKLRKSEQIKSQQSLTQQKIKIFHTEKLQDISRIKKKQEEEKQSRIDRSEKLMEKINEQKLASHNKFNETHNSLKNLRVAVKKIKFMKPEEFSVIINDTINDDINHSNSNINQTIISQMNEFQSPIYGRQNRFTAGEQLIASKIINRMLEQSQTVRQEKSFC